MEGIIGTENWRNYVLFLLILLFACLFFHVRLLGAQSVPYLKLDGTGDRAEGNTTIFPVSSILTSFTVEAWIFPTVSGKYIMTDDAYDLILYYQSGAANNGNGIKFVVYSQSAFTEKTEFRDVRLNQWNHIAAMFNSSTYPPQMTIAINGNVSSSPVDYTQGSFAVYNDQHFTVGGFYSNSSGNFSGFIDEVRISHNVRYASNFTPDSSFACDSDVMAIFHFNEGNGSTSFTSDDSCPSVYTLSGTGNAATLVFLSSFSITYMEEGYALIKWITRSEVNNTGFHLLRSLKEYDDYTRITQDLIISEGNAYSGAMYAYKDYDIIPGKIYFYVLEDIDNEGKSSFHGPFYDNHKDINEMFFERTRSELVSDSPTVESMNDKDGYDAGICFLSVININY